MRKLKLIPYLSQKRTHTHFTSETFTQSKLLQLQSIDKKGFKERDSTKKNVEMMV